MFNYDLGRQCLVAEGWCPKNSLESIQLALRRGRVRLFVNMRLLQWLTFVTGTERSYCAFDFEQD